MIVGSGFIAENLKSYKDDESILIFASGSSNSKETNLASFARERELLIKSMEINQNKKIIYFGTCSVFDPGEINSLYVAHKLEMERLIARSKSDYSIFRVPQLAGKNKNQYTLLNYLYYCISKNTCFDLWKNVERNILDIDTLINLVDYCITKNIFTNTIINIASPFNTKIVDLVEIFERILNKSAYYNAIEYGNSYAIDISDIRPIMKILNINFENNYLENVLKKYYEY